MSRYRQALLCFRRALQLDPKNRLARDGYWQVHCSLDLTAWPTILKPWPWSISISVSTRAGSLLLESGPSPQRLAEAYRLLDLVQSQRPELWAPVAYWRAVAFTHAAQSRPGLRRTGKSPRFVPQGSSRTAATNGPGPGLGVGPGAARGITTTGRPGPGTPGQVSEWRPFSLWNDTWRSRPEDATAWNLKRLLYQDVTEADYQAAGAGETLSSFDHAYVHQMGLALINDPNRWQRGAEFCVWPREDFPPWLQLSTSR